MADTTTLCSRRPSSAPLVNLHTFIRALPLHRNLLSSLGILVVQTRPDSSPRMCAIVSAQQ